jgi:hypothetical protein
VTEAAEERTSAEAGRAALKQRVPVPETPKVRREANG